LEGVRCLDTLALSLVLGLLNHALDFLLAKTTHLVHDRYGLGLAGSLVGGGDPKDTIGIDL